MAAKRMFVLLGFLLTGPLLAGDGFGPQCRDCPRGEYSWLHYWAPAYYEARAHFHPRSLDQYPPGPEPSVPPSYEIERYRCPGLPPMPSSPYADPDRYYGRPVAPK